jgi:hypothetical protein
MIIQQGIDWRTAMAANPRSKPTNKDNQDRTQLLLHMYDQMFNDIDRHILVIWQAIAAIIGAFAFLALVEKSIVSIDIAIALIVLVAAWLIAHVYDAAYWYNRNLVIIANIERQFLLPEDQRNIHYYFGNHRPNNKMMMHLRIQFLLGVGLAAIVLLYHFMTRIWDGVERARAEGLHSEIWLRTANPSDVQRLLPYVTLVCAFLVVLWVRNNRNKSYQNFLENSPGVQLDTSGISYGAGHPGFRVVQGNLTPE